MPEAFEECRKRGGKVRTVLGPSKQFGLKADEYVHLCILGKQVVRGEVKKKEKGESLLTGSA